MVTTRPSYPAAKLDYVLPPELIAQQPLARRDGSRMLLVQPARFDAARPETLATALSDRRFAELPGLLPSGTLIVLNDSKVLPARLIGQRASGAMVEVLFLRWLGEPAAAPGEHDESGLCEALVGSNATLAVGELITLPHGWSVELLEPKSLNGTKVRFRYPGGHPAELQVLLGYLRANGRMPLPPYIKRDVVGVGLVPTQAPVGVGQRPHPEQEGADTAAPLQSQDGRGQAPPLQDDVDRYQTVYADAAHEGSAAAPTAGLHFEAGTLAELERHGHSIARVTLHVGLGTFQPLKVADLAEHEMHEEAFSVDTLTARDYIEAIEAGRPVLAVGTTSLRVLHTLLGMHRDYPDFLASLAERGTASGMTRAFIYPGQDTDAATHLLTNFHLPKSTLLALVYSFGSEALLQAAYQHAIEQRYRFFSYGDCMLVERRE